MGIQRRAVVSSVIKSLGYDLKTRFLDIEFQETGLYRYFHVPAFVYEDLMRAPSKGHFFDVHIRDVYQYEKL